MTELFLLSQRLADAGISTIPIRVDGSKALPIEWKNYQDHIATPGERENFFGEGRSVGIAAVCGKVSRDLEVIDIDAPSLRKIGRTS